MRKILCGMIAVGAATSASAQNSNVTLYGIVDNGLQYETGLPKGNVFGAPDCVVAPVYLHTLSN